MAVLVLVVNGVTQVGFRIAATTREPIPARITRYFP